MFGSLPASVLDVFSLELVSSSSSSLFVRSIMLSSKKNYWYEVIQFFLPIGANSDLIWMLLPITVLEELGPGKGSSRNSYHLCNCPLIVERRAIPAKNRRSAPGDSMPSCSCLAYASSLSYWLTRRIAAYNGRQKINLIKNLMILRVIKYLSKKLKFYFDLSLLLN